MRFMLLIHHNEAEVAKTSPQDWQAMATEYAAFKDAMAKAGIGLPGERLQPSSASTTVRQRDGKTEVLDGPYADTKEQLAGYYMIDVPDLDQAILWAGRCPGSKQGIVEIRPIWDNVYGQG